MNLAIYIFAIIGFSSTLIAVGACVYYFFFAPPLDIVNEEQNKGTNNE